MKFKKLMEYATTEWVSDLWQRFVCCYSNHLSIIYSTIKDAFYILNILKAHQHTFCRYFLSTMMFKAIFNQLWMIAEATLRSQYLLDFSRFLRFRFNEHIIV